MKNNPLFGLNTLLLIITLYFRQPDFANLFRELTTNNFYKYLLDLTANYCGIAIPMSKVFIRIKAWIQRRNTMLAPVSTVYPIAGPIVTAPAAGTFILSPVDLQPIAMTVTWSDYSTVWCGWRSAEATKISTAFGTALSSNHS